MLVFDGLVRGRVTYEVAGGPPARIPTGRRRVEAHEGFVSVSWPHEDCTRSATMRSSQFEEWLEAGAVLVLDAAQLAQPRVSARVLAPRCPVGPDDGRWSMRADMRTKHAKRVSNWLQTSR